jgi:hypothetical protein
MNMRKTPDLPTVTEPTTLCKRTRAPAKLYNRANVVQVETRPVASGCPLFGVLGDELFATVMIRWKSSTVASSRCCYMQIV